MISRRLVIAMLAAFALFLGASLYLVNRLTSPPPDTREAAVVPTPASEVTGPGAAPAGSDLPAAQAAKDLRPVIEPGPPPPPPPPPGSWEAVKIATRPAVLGQVGSALGRELNELQPEVSACFDEDTQARHGMLGVSAVRDAAPQDDTGTTVLVLQLETTGGAVRIVDAPVETRGQASDGLLACVQRTLRGRQAEVPAARAGQRYRVLYTLVP